jgi:hypothetical protein
MVVMSQICDFGSEKSVGYLIIKAAATFRTLGHLTKATTVSKLPQMPTIMIRIVRMAAIVSCVLLNL